MQVTRRHILEYLRANGRGTVAALSTAAAVAPVTVRHHLTVLREANLVDSTTETVGRGRPRHVYRLTACGAEALVAQHAYATLTASLIDALRVSDAAAPRRLLRDVALRISADARVASEGRPIEDRLDAAVGALTAEGFTIEWERDGDDFVVHEVGCPYRMLADVQADVCDLDLEVLRLVVGPGISRDGWRLAGDPGCAFRVRGPSASETR